MFSTRFRTYMKELESALSRDLTRDAEDKYRKEVTKYFEEKRDYPELKAEYDKAIDVHNKLVKELEDRIELAVQEDDMMRQRSCGFDWPSSSHQRLQPCRRSRLDLMRWSSSFRPPSLGTCTCGSMACQRRFGAL